MCKKWGEVVPNSAGYLTVKQAPEWNMTKQLDLGPKTREGHEEEHSRTS